MAVFQWIVFADFSQPLFLSDLKLWNLFEEPIIFVAAEPAEQQSG